MTRAELGGVMRDRITGFRGTVIGRTEWLTGCATVALQPRVDKDGKVPDPEWFDENRLETVELAAAAGQMALPMTEAGGPRPTPQRTTAGGR